MNPDTINSVTATRVPEERRVRTLPAHFGPQHMMRIESAVYDWMRSINPEYRGGFWHFYELSNGGFYMALDTEGPLRCEVDGNGYSGALTADALGIIATLFALSHLSFEISDDRIAEHFHLLRDFAAEHPEASDIFQAID